MIEFAVDPFGWFESLEVGFAVAIEQKTFDETVPFQNNL